MQSNTNVQLEGSNSFAKEEVDQNIIMDYAEKYKDDPSYAPLSWIQERTPSNE